MISVMRSKTTRILGLLPQTENQILALIPRPRESGKSWSGQVVSAHGHALLPIKAGSVEGKVGLVGVLAQHTFRIIVTLMSPCKRTDNGFTEERSDVKTEKDYVPVSHHVILPFKSHFTCFMGRGLGAGLFEIVVPDYLGPYKASFDV